MFCTIFFFTLFIDNFLWFIPLNDWYYDIGMPKWLVLFDFCLLASFCLNVHFGKYAFKIFKNGKRDWEHFPIVNGELVVGSLVFREGDMVYDMPSSYRNYI